MVVRVVRLGSARIEGEGIRLNCWPSFPRAAISRLVATAKSKHDAIVRFFEFSWPREAQLSNEGIMCTMMARNHDHDHDYGAYFRDADGNKRCIACHQAE